MKKALILLVALSFLLTGCFATSSESSNTNSSNNFKKEASFEQPQEKADIMGIVESINGNEVTILKMEIGERNQEFTEKNEDGSEIENKTLSLGGSSAPTGGMRMGGMKKSEGEVDEDAKAQMLSKMKEMSSGSETVIIPVGIQMLKIDTDNREMVTASLIDVESDQILSIWLNPEITDRNIAKFVLIK